MISSVVSYLYKLLQIKNFTIHLYSIQNHETIEPKKKKKKKICTLFQNYCKKREGFKCNW